QSPLREGLAVFYGGSMGNELAWHIKRLNQYLAKHEEVDLDKMDDFYYMDNYTNPRSAIAGLLSMDAYKKNGIAGLKNIMAYTSLDDIFLKEYNVGKGGWNVLLRKMIRDNSK